MHAGDYAHAGDGPDVRVAPQELPLPLSRRFGLRLLSGPARRRMLPWMGNTTSCSSYAMRCAVLVLAATAWPASSGAAGGLVPQHSEYLRPTLTRESKGDTATLEFSAFGRDFHVELVRNQRLAQVATGSSMQLYEGTVEGIPRSWVRISVLDGLPRGMIWDGRELFVVDADAEGVNYGAAGTVMYKLSDAVFERGVSLADDAVKIPSDAAARYGALIGELRTRTQSLEDGVATEAVEISVLGDANFVARYASEAQARDAILARLNNVDGIFSAQVGVALQVVSVDVEGEPAASLTATTDSNALLQELGRLRQRTAALSTTGLSHLFTGRNLDGDTAGIAYELSLCSPRYSASLTESRNSVVLDSLITAHEIGHVFGAPHDGAEQCPSTPQNQYIMAPNLNSAVTSFSQCSLDKINAVLDSYSCVVTMPPPAPGPSPAPPAPPPADGGGGGGGGSLDASLLALLLALRAARRRRLEGTASIRRPLLRGDRREHEPYSAVV